jgi:hypothetical protein
VRLETGFVGDEPLLVIEDVLVRAGERTLDPRLCEVDLSRFATPTNEPVRAPSAREPIVLQIVDREGRSIPEGRLFDARGGYRSVSVWLGGRVRIEGNRRDAHFTIWSPGFCAWSGECPERSGELRLEPAWRIGFEYQVPEALRRPDRLVRVVPSVVICGFASERVLDHLAPAVLGSDGRVRFEVPGPCELGFALQLIALDQSGTAFREGVEPQEVDNFSMQIPPGNNAYEIEVEPERWAAAEKALSEKK